MDDEWVVRLAGCLGDGDGRGVGEPVGRSDDEVLEEVARVESGLGGGAALEWDDVGLLRPAGDERVVILLVVELGEVDVLGLGAPGLRPERRFVDLSSCALRASREVISTSVGSIVTMSRISWPREFDRAFSRAGRTRDSSWARVRSSWTATIRMPLWRLRGVALKTQTLAPGERVSTACSQWAPSSTSSARSGASPIPDLRCSTWLSTQCASICRRGIHCGKVEYRGDASSGANPVQADFPIPLRLPGVSPGRASHSCHQKVGLTVERCPRTVVWSSARHLPRAHSESDSVGERWPSTGSHRTVCKPEE